MKCEVKAIIPDVSETELIITEIYVKSGEKVKKGQVICTLEGLKSTIDIEAPCEGYIHWLYSVGDVVSVNTTIAIVSESPEWKPERKEEKPQSQKFSETRPKSIRYKYDYERVVIIGAGRGAGVVYDILSRSPHQIPIGMVGKPVENTILPPIPLLFTSDKAFLSWDREAYDSIIISFAYPNLKARHEVYQMYKEHGIPFTTAIHPSAIIGKFVKIGEGTIIGMNTSIGFGSIVGANLWISAGVTVEHHNVIGDHTLLAPGVTTAGSVKIGSGCLIGSGVIIVNNITIGDNAHILSGKVITEDVPPGSFIK